MKPIKGYNAAQASGGFERLAPGGYVVKILDVKNDEAKEYLKVVYDIVEGSEAGRFKNEEPDNDYRHSFIRSYKEKALGMFKSFIRAIDESNGTKFDERIEKGLNEPELIGKILGVVIGYEEYDANDGTVKQRQRLVSCMSADRIRRGEFKVPELKKLEGTSAPAVSPVAGLSPFNDADLPF